MRIHFYAARVRPDILCIVNFLTKRTRLGTTSIEEKGKLHRLLNYIQTTRMDSIVLGGDSNGKLRLRAYADASYGIHMDGKSHTSIVITLGRGPVTVRAPSRSWSRNPVVRLVDSCTLRHRFDSGVDQRLSK